jgi:hypothetical protein
MSKIEVLSFVWGRPIIVWSSDGLPKPGLIGFVADVTPINIVYSNGTHYDALIGLDSDASLIAATAALYLKGRTSTLSARANVVNLVIICLSKSLVIDVTHRLMNLLSLHVNMAPLSARLMINLLALRRQTAVLLTGSERRIINGG